MQHTNGRLCFTNQNGEEIYLFTLRNKKGTTVEITNYGAIISAFRVKNVNGNMQDIVLGFDDVARYLSKEYLDNYPYFGAVIGRYTNRIKNGEFLLDGKKYQLAKNKNTDHLHGGNTGFDRKVWKVVSASVSGLQLRYISPNGEEGYPGTLTADIRFELTEDNELVYEFFASCVEPTIVNLTHHSYFNLDGADTIGAHEVKINASNTLEQDENYVVTGKLLPVDRSMYDFRQSKPIDKDWNGDEGYDQTFVIDRQGVEPALAAEAFSPISGITLQVYTTEPVVHFYTGKWIPQIKGKDGRTYGPFSGFCFETHKHPNAINIPGFPNTILRPGEKYQSRTIYRIR